MGGSSFEVDGGGTHPDRGVVNAGDTSRGPAPATDDPRDLAGVARVADRALGEAVGPGGDPRFDQTAGPRLRSRVIVRLATAAFGRYPRRHDLLLVLPLPPDSRLSWARVSRGERPGCPTDQGKHRSPLPAYRPTSAVEGNGTIRP